MDGIRGAAVLGILLFHAGHLEGGWLGVDLFFVLSGFLITSLLIAEFEATGEISVPSFWARRARRLLPALFAALLGVTAYAALLAPPEQLQRIRMDTLATLFYVANWHAVSAGHEYWELFRAPSPLDHTWSLAIEEQFYLLWPPLAYLILRGTRGSVRSLAIAAALLGTLSAVWMATLFHPSAGTARVYFGTDTRAAATLLGAALAGVLRGSLRVWPKGSNPIGDVAGLAGAGVLVLAWVFLSGQEPSLYRGGLFGLSLAAALVIGGVVVAPQGWLACIFRITALRLLGVISYGVYLWHWPIYLVLTPQRVGVGGWTLTAVRVTVTLAVAAASYVFLERSIRRGTLLAHHAAPVALGACGAVMVSVAWATHNAPSGPEATSLSLPALSQADAPQGRTDVLLIGDSMAQTMAPEFREQAERRGLRVHTLAFFGCGLLHSTRLRLWEKEQDLTSCLEMAAYWEQWVALHHPRVVLVVEGWPGAGDREISGLWSHPCEPAYDTALSEALAAAVRDFRDHGAITVIVTCPPAYVADLPPNFMKLIGERPRDELEQLLNQRSDCQNRVRRRVVAEDGARVVDLERFVCPGGVCHREIDGVVLRSDGVHFSGRGASLISSWLLDQITPITRQQ